MCNLYSREYTTEELDFVARDIAVLCEKLESMAFRHPLLVVFCCHELFRSLYPHDPFISQRYADDQLDNIQQCLETLSGMVRFAAEIPSYQLSNAQVSQHEAKGLEIFTDLWEQREAEGLLRSLGVLEDLFSSNGLSLEQVLRGKRVLDMGCGSGRFSVAMAQYADSVVGIDINASGLEVANRFSVSQRITNVEYVHGDVTNLPFSNAEFDFVFSKGVLHHTGNTAGALKEYARVMRDGGGGFLYLYASGGLYWPARKLMRRVMKNIPSEVALNALSLIGVPARRTIFYDSWYVPVEDHIDLQWCLDTLVNEGCKNIQRLFSQRPFELDRVASESQNGAGIWGAGEIRLMVQK